MTINNCKSVIERVQELIVVRRITGSLEKELNILKDMLKEKAYLRLHVNLIMFDKASLQVTCYNHKVYATAPCSYNMC